jgi:hypothetical protein
MSIEMELAQRNFLQQGGVLQRALMEKMKSGELPSTYEYREYPKEIRISRGFHDVECETEVGNGSRKITWNENREVIERIIVNSEEEEDAVLYGGKTAVQIEEDRQGLLTRARALGIKVDASWSAIRLRRELGDQLGGVETQDQLAALQKELAGLKKVAEMQAEIDALKAQLGGRHQDSTEDLKAQLEALGVTVDGRWSAKRMREELERATAPERDAA